MHKQKKIILGILTILPFIYSLLFIASILFMIISKSHDFFVILRIVHIIFILLTFGLLIFYITNIFKNVNFSITKKALWALLIFLGNTIAMPIYWYLYIWTDQKSKSSSINTKIILFSIVITLFLILFLFQRQIRNASFIVEPTGKSLVLEDGIITETATPGLHIRFFKPDSIFFYPTQRVFRLKIDVLHLKKLTLPDSIRTIEFTWNVYDPNKFYEKIGGFNESIINKKVNSKFLSAIESKTYDHENDFNKFINELNRQYENELIDYGIKFYKISFKSN